MLAQRMNTRGLAVRVVRDFPDRGPAKRANGAGEKAGAPAACEIEGWKRKGGKGWSGGAGRAYGTTKVAVPENEPCPTATSR